MGWKYEFVCDACLLEKKGERTSLHTATVYVGSIATFEICHDCSTKMLEGNPESKRTMALRMLSLIKPG